MLALLFLLRSEFKHCYAFGFESFLAELVNLENILDVDLTVVRRNHSFFDQHQEVERLAQ